MSEIINVFAKPVEKKMPLGAKIALIIGAVIFALAFVAKFALGALGMVSVGAVLMLDIDMMDISFLVEDFLFFLDGYYV